MFFTDPGLIAFTALHQYACEYESKWCDRDDTAAAVRGRELPVQRPSVHVLAKQHAGFERLVERAAESLTGQRLNPSLGLTTRCNC